MSRAFSRARSDGTHTGSWLFARATSFAAMSARAASTKAFGTPPRFSAVDRSVGTVTVNAIRSCKASGDPEPEPGVVRDQHREPVGGVDLPDIGVGGVDVRAPVIAHRKEHCLHLLRCARQLVGEERTPFPHGLQQRPVNPGEPRRRRRIGVVTADDVFDGGLAVERQLQQVWSCDLRESGLAGAWFTGEADSPPVVDGGAHDSDVNDAADHPRKVRVSGRGAVRLVGVGGDRRFQVGAGGVTVPVHRGGRRYRRPGRHWRTVRSARRGRPP